MKKSPLDSARSISWGVLLKLLNDAFHHLWQCFRDRPRTAYRRDGGYSMKSLSRFSRDLFGQGPPPAPTRSGYFDVIVP